MTTPLLRTQAGDYRWHDQWITIPDTESGRANGRTHGVAVSRDGRVFLFHQAVPGVLVYSPEGRLLASWGDYPGAHGMTLVEENGEEFLWLADEHRAAVEKTTLDGKVVQSIAKPDHPAYAEGKYIPTWAAVNETRFGGNGDVWVTDGYGSHLVHRYDAAGRYLQTIDGTEGAGRFRCPHGIAFDSRKKSPELYVADRSHKRVQVFDGEGKFLRSFGTDFLTSPDGFVFSGERLIVPELAARVSILDADDRLVAILGENDAVAQQPGWPNETPLEPGKFNSPHGAGADAHGNIFVAEWRLGGRVTKLERL